MSTEADKPGRGHNLPADAPELRVPDTLDGEQIKLQLADFNDDILERREDLLKAFGRFTEAVPSINDDETLTKAGAYAMQITDCIKEAEGRRQAAKAPFLAGGAAVDGFFTGSIIGPLKAAVDHVRGLQTAYNTAKAARLRAEAEEKGRIARDEARKQFLEAQEADRKRKEAVQAERMALQAALDAKNKRERDEALRQQAEAKAHREAAEAEQKAREEEGARAQQDVRAAEQTATATAAELTRTRGDLAMTTTRTVWKFTVVDINKVPAHFLQVNEKLVKAAIGGKSGQRDIPGLHIYSEEEAINRR